jgi:hypothetical protein
VRRLLLTSASISLAPCGGHLIVITFPWSETRHSVTDTHNPSISTRRRISRAPRGGGGAWRAAAARTASSPTAVDLSVMV